MSPGQNRNQNVITFDIEFTTVRPTRRFKRPSHTVLHRTDSTMILAKQIVQTDQQDEFSLLISTLAAT